MKNTSVQKPKSAFGVNDSLALKGIAIILMIFHHCFRLKEWIDDYQVVTFPLDAETVAAFSGMFKICVPIFAFISGYGLYLSAKKKCTGPNETQNWIIIRLIKTLSGFWFVYILSFVITQIFFSYPQSIYCTDGIARGTVFAIFDFLGLANLFGTPTLIAEWWYMTAAVIFIAVMPIMLKWLNTFGTVSLIIIIMALPRLAGIGYPGGMNAYTFLFAVLMGMLFARYDLFGKIDNIKLAKNKYINAITVFILMCVVLAASIFMFFRISVKTLWEYNYGVFAVIFVVFCKKYVIRIPVLDKILAFFGKHSMNIFLIHSFFVYKFYTEFIYSFKHFLLIAGVLFGISFAISVFIIEPLKKLVRFDKLMDKLSNKLCAVINR